MINTLLAVHGVGVRGPSGGATFRRLDETVAEVSPRIRVSHCDWGDSCGAELLADGASLPAEGIGEPPVGDGPWSLDDDPLVELRLLATMSGGRSADSPARQALLGRLGDLPADPKVLAAFESVGMAAEFPGAVAVVSHAEPTRLALADAENWGTQLNVALAWAIVATTMARAGAPGLPVALDGETMRTLADLVTDQLGGPPGLGVITRRLAGAGASLLSLWTERRRAELTAGATRYAGDVAKYLRDPAPLRAAIRTAIIEANPPVVVVAHSLGGVACVELLAGEDPPPIHTLITVGSQVSYLYEIDALPNLRFDATLPSDFPTWINVLDPRDLLAFAARPLFCGFAVDRVVHNGAPFPRAHSAYFGNRAFHEILREVLE